MLIRRHRAVSQALEQTTFLPFLYHTRTIARLYATRHDIIDEALESSDTPDEAHRESTRLRQQSRQRQSNGAPFREFGDHVPFEGSMRQNAHADFEGSTITPSERRAFEKLFKLRDGKDGRTKEEATVADQKPVKSKLQKLDDIMDAAGKEAGGEFDGAHSKFPQPLQRMAREAQEQRKRDSKPSQSDAIAAAAKKDLSHVSKQVGKAKTDVELWNTLQKHVFKRVLALDLDGTPRKKSRRARKDQSLEEEEADTSTDPLVTPTNDPKTKNPQPPITDLSILTLTLPHHLTRAHRTLTISFPSSPLPLTLLPYLRTLGPTAFALGTSTQLYNMHMRTLYRTSLDLDGVVDTLAEMDAQVYEYDEFTEALIARILSHARDGTEGRWGEGVRALWEGEGMRRRVGRVFSWGKRVRGRREEEALRRANAQEEEEMRGESEGG